MTADDFIALLTISNKKLIKQKQKSREIKLIWFPPYAQLTPPRLHVNVNEKPDLVSEKNTLVALRWIELARSSSF